MALNKKAETNFEPYRLAINRVRAEKLAETYRELEDCIVGLDATRKTVKKAMNIISRISSEMYEGELVECRERRNRIPESVKMRT